MPSVTDIQVLISLLIFAAFVLPFYKAFEERRKTKRAAEDKEIAEKKAQADQLHQRINEEKNARHKNDIKIADIQGYDRGFKDGLAEARKQIELTMKIAE